MTSYRRIRKPKRIDGNPLNRGRIRQQNHANHSNNANPMLKLLQKNFI
jgi:hypothetical protein